jgi:hypothetical protein
LSGGHQRLQKAHRGLPNHLGDASKKENDTAVCRYLVIYYKWIKYIIVI